jgi:hypothetical protein
VAVNSRFTGAQARWQQLTDPYLLLASAAWIFCSKISDEPACRLDQTRSLFLILGGAMSPPCHVFTVCTSSDIGKDLQPRLN